MRGPAADVRLLAVEAWRRAEAMGLLDEDGQAGRQLDRRAMTRLFNRVRAAGIARGPALRLDNVETPSNEDLASMLRLVIAALEASPVAKYEWPAVTRVFEPEPLAELLGISLSSLRRYLSGARDTPDDVAVRLGGEEFALVLSGLAGRSPAALLGGEWNPEDKGPQHVRALAQSLTALTAT